MVQHFSIFVSAASLSVKQDAIPRVLVPIRLEWEAEGKTETETITECRNASEDSSDFLGVFGNTRLKIADEASSATTRSSVLSTNAVRFGEENEQREFQAKAIKTHNAYRAKHGVDALTLDVKLCQYAEEWAKILAENDKFEHRDCQNYGENLYCIWSSNLKAECDGQKPVDSWYSEISLYDHNNPHSNHLKTGHFTQLVWKDSKRLGIAKAKTSSGKTIVVANYDPPGNFIGEYEHNVTRPQEM